MPHLCRFVPTDTIYVSNLRKTNYNMLQHVYAIKLIYVFHLLETLINIFLLKFLFDSFGPTYIK